MLWCTVMETSGGHHAQVFFSSDESPERIGFRTPVAISIGRGRSTALDLETTPLPVALQRGGEVKFNPLSLLLDHIDS